MDPSRAFLCREQFELVDNLMVTEWFRWEQAELSQNPDWFVFERGDVAARLGR